MLQSLYIKNFILIDELQLDISNGMTVLTGETGAGKSILLGALHAVLGKRLTVKGVLKDEKVKAVIELTLDVKENMRGAFESLELDYQPISILRRELLPNGKTRCFVNDSPTKIKALQELTTGLVDINSQKDEGLIHRPVEQLVLIDSFCDVDEVFSMYQTEYKSLKKVLASLNKLLAMDDAQDLDYLQFVRDELKKANIDVTRYYGLEEEINEAKKVRTSQGALENAIQVITNDDGLLDQLYSLESALMQLDESNASSLEDLQGAIAVVKGIERNVREGIRSSISEGEYQALVDEKTNIDALIRKHRVLTVEQLKDKYDAIVEKIFQIEHRDAELSRLQKEQQTLEKSLVKWGEQMHAIRLKAAAKIEQALSDYLLRVDLPKARLKLDWKKVDIGPHGLYMPHFMFAANPGSPLAELSKSASGGEQSRVKLALKAVLGKNSGLSTQIFDEIDTGISGSTAEKVGELMKEMSMNQQIIAITHLPQVAAKGNTHLLVSKTQEQESTHSNVVPLNKQQRMHELARMLSGEKITTAAKKQAQSLLEAR